MPHSDTPLRVAVAEDSALLRDGLVLQLEAAGITVTGAFATADELIDHVSAYPPDAVTLDIRMPPSFTDEGIRAAATLKSENPNIGVLILSTYKEAAYSEAVVEIATTGIGYLIKERVTSVAALHDALTRIIGGGCVMDPEVIQALIRRPRNRISIDRLTPRERSVLQLMAEGLSNTRIAEELSVAIRTVEANTAAIFDKLNLHEDSGANRRVQAVLAWLHGHESMDYSPRG